MAEGPGFIAAILAKHPRRSSSVVSNNRHGSEVYRAIVTRPGIHGHVPVYYKIFRPESQPTALFNEIFSYKLVRKLGFPCPDDVWFCSCKKALIIGPTRCLDGRDPASPWLRGVASVDLNPRGIIQVMSYKSRLFQVELLGWPLLAKAAALDEWILNTDRHGQNLLPRIGKEKFALIDHDKAFGGPGWSIQELANKLQKPAPSNQLASFISESQGDTGQRLKSEMITYATQLSKIEVTESFIGYEFDRLDVDCGLEIGTTEQVVRLLNSRKSRISEFLMHHITAGEMFAQ